MSSKEPEVTLPPIFELFVPKKKSETTNAFTPPENLPLIHEKESPPFILHEEKKTENNLSSSSPSFIYTPKITEIPKNEEVVTSRIEGLASPISPLAKRVIHYTSYKTDLSHAFAPTTHILPEKEREAKIKKPISRWFI
jgi:hypothetical protein